MERGEREMRREGERVESKRKYLARKRYVVYGKYEGGQKLDERYFSSCRRVCTAAGGKCKDCQLWCDEPASEGRQRHGLESRIGGLLGLGLTMARSRLRDFSDKEAFWRDGVAVCEVRCMYSGYPLEHLPGRVLPLGVKEGTWAPG